ncbi:thermonuclease family protein [Flavisphingomonas formosensis]|uniref:thermonuclease family protein n=1 Tax=Flavisphingomonas formosensis TaxID=861534 RepID=UPI001E5F3B94|nr:thermonuclease family protein [Sphingomonas formosensis]
MITTVLALLLASASLAYPDTITDRRVTDGDTIRCGRERIRLRGIDAPELPGHCRQDRDCAPGDPFASTDSLRAAMAPTMRIRRIERDRYGRTVAVVSGPKGDLSCWQLRQGQAIYKLQWDRTRVLAGICPADAQR